MTEGMDFMRLNAAYILCCKGGVKGGYVLLIRSLPLDCHLTWMDQEVLWNFSRAVQTGPLLDKGLQPYERKA